MITISTLSATIVPRHLLCDLCSGSFLFICFVPPYLADYVSSFSSSLESDILPVGLIALDDVLIRFGNLLCPVAFSLLTSLVQFGPCHPITLFLCICPCVSHCVCLCTSFSLYFYNSPRLAFPAIDFCFLLLAEILLMFFISFFFAPSASFLFFFFLIFFFFFLFFFFTYLFKKIPASLFSSFFFFFLFPFSSSF